MIELNSKLLKSLGIKLNVKQENQLLKHIKSTLDERVGITAVELLDDNQISKFMGLGQAEKANWLATNLPEYKEVVEDEFDILIGEIAEGSSQFAIA